ncbi:hypothetical protein DLAC_11789 [Tieghemostelium lacteum]|uniref:Transmembrane protein n=1 Tax=Tieghemostelium lacteum TaxID=361077 RepID=A0A151Z7A5_TIELA|nr:hypothetical protein DLAC_11789 [Tieghemostelium lacteum]|eukprot:KYQ89842.1 hypothetical protein DLAC_11789 [Tieghemostelium lacteum]
MSSENNLSYLQQQENNYNNNNTENDVISTSVNNNNSNNEEPNLTFSYKDNNNFNSSESPGIIGTSPSYNNSNLQSTSSDTKPYPNTNTSTTNNNNGYINTSNGVLVLDNNDSINSGLQNSNISSSTPGQYEFSTKNSMDEIVVFQKPPSLRSLAIRIGLSWLFGLICQVILMLFNPTLPMHFIWGVLCIGCGMTAAFAITWASLLIKFPITFLIIFSTTIYWVGTPITWQILLLTKLYPPPIGVFTSIFPFEGLSLVLLCFLIPKTIRSQPGHRKKVITAFSSLVAPYLSFVSGLIYFRLFQYSNNTGRILLPPVYTIIMKVIQLGLDIICVRCAHSGSNLLIILGRVIASYYSFAVLSFIRNPVSVVSVVLSKLALHIFMSLFMIFPQIEVKIISFLPKSLVGWKTSFEKGTKDKEPTPTTKGGETPDGAQIQAITHNHQENEFDRMAMENDPQFVNIHTRGTNLWFSMFSDLLSIVMTITVYTMGRYGPTRQHYNKMFPFADDSGSPLIHDSFHLFIFYLAICFVALLALYSIMFFVLKKIIKTLEFRKVINLVSVNWFPLHHFYISCINFMMGYVIVVVALMPDLFYIPSINFWNTGQNK